MRSQMKSSIKSQLIYDVTKFLMIKSLIFALYALMYDFFDIFAKNFDQKYQRFFKN